MQDNTSVLQGKTIIVVGGSSGLGLATARAAAAEGAHVIIVSGNQQRIDKALTALPVGSRGYAVDVSKEENIQQFFTQAGKFDHLVYTAGENLSMGALSTMKLNDARSFFNIRYWGALAAVKYAAPNINLGGSINLTSGTASRRSGSGWAIASSICGAMEAFGRAMAIELSPIRVNSVVPGVIKTNLWDSMAAEDRNNLYKVVGNAALVKRVGEAADVALAFIYLMKQQFGTGQNIVIDGGGVLV
jgi:NAD(P)-dependent dehydrogenase (short-subunit alcohol dehydrogenase family)